MSHVNLFLYPIQTIRLSRLRCPQPSRRCHLGVCGGWSRHPRAVDPIDASLRWHQRGIGILDIEVVALPVPRELPSGAPICRTAPSARFTQH